MDNCREVAKKIQHLKEQAASIMTSDPERCINISREALDIASESNYDIGIAIAHQQIGSGYYHQGNYLEALKHYTEAEKVFEKAQSFRGLRSIYNNIGIIYTEWNDLENALRFFKMNLKLESKYSNPKLTCSILNNIGRVYSILNDNDRALLYYKESLTVSKEHNLLYGESVALLNIGCRYSAVNEPDKAEEYLLKAIKVNESISNMSCSVNAYASLSELKSEAGQYDEALWLLNKALEYAKDLDESAKIANIYLSFAKIFKKKNQLLEQERYLKSCVSLAEPNGYRSISLSAYTMLAEMSEKKSDYKSSSYYYKKQLEIKDYLNDERRLRVIHSILMKLELERAETEKEQYRLKALELEKQNRLIVVRNTFNKLLDHEGFSQKHHIVFESEKMNEILLLMDQVAKTDFTDVLITGESGTGKELVARGIHLLSSRKDHVFFDVNCTAVPDNLFESEFFGHIKGAFTGASSSKKGVFEAANKGTLFLDEIGDLPISMQTKLLRVLEDRKIRKVGSLEDIHLDIRIITSTNQNIINKIQQNKFRQDLYYRLNKFSIHVPPIRQRPEDIIPIVNYYIEKFCHTMRKQLKYFSPDSLDILVRYDFPGNVRELKNIVEKAVILSRGNDKYLRIHDFNVQHNKSFSKKNYAKMVDLSPMVLADKEKGAIIEAMKKTGNNKTQAAKLLNITRSSLRRRIDKYKLTF